MKFTLLELVQEILSSTDGDEVNSINDNAEAQQVARLVRSSYFDMVGQNFPEHYGIYTLAASGDLTQPTVMTLPTDANTLEWLKYNVIDIDDTAPSFQKLTFQPMDVFFDRMLGLSLDSDNVGTFALGDLPVYYTDDAAPQFYTSFDDRTILFDSYDAEVDDTLQASKSIAYGLKSIPFTLTDSFTPNLDDPQFITLLNKTKARVFEEQLGISHQGAERDARRGMIRGQVSKQAVKKEPFFNTVPNYGRK